MNANRIRLGLLVALICTVLLPVAGSLGGHQYAPLFAQSSCNADGATLCLNNGRFEITIRYETSNGDSGVGMAVKLTNDTGYFYFFDEANVEVVVKVLDGCAINNNFWVFAGGLTDVEVTMTIRDTESGNIKVFDNPQKTPFDPVQDTSAFMTC